MPAALANPTYVLIAINVGVSLAGFAFAGRAAWRHFVFVPHQVRRGHGLLGMVLSHFSHADVGHLALNAFGLFVFGPLLGGSLGEQALWAIYGISGAVATLTVFAFRQGNPRFSALGASGSIAGVLFAAIVARPSLDLHLLFIPVPIPGPVFAVVYLVLSTYLIGRHKQGVCHEAHAGGALAGAVLAGVLAPRGFDPLLQRVLQLVG